MDRHLSSRDWAPALKRFTNRNAGRRAVLEIGDIGLGAQEIGGAALRGVAWDPRDGRIEIMLGEQADVDRHLTHTIVCPVCVDLLVAEDGRDRVLRILSAEGQTLLRLE